MKGPYSKENDSCIYSYLDASSQLPMTVARCR
jgi:hypothetical protein